MSANELAVESPDEGITVNQSIRIAREIARLERKFSRAASRGDRKTVSALVARDFIAADPWGRTLRRADVLDLVTRGDFQLETLTADIDVRVFVGTRGALATAGGTMRIDEHGRVKRVRYLRVWVQRKRGWQAVAIHATLIVDSV